MKREHDGPRFHRQAGTSDDKNKHFIPPRADALPFDDLPNNSAVFEDEDD